MPDPAAPSACGIAGQVRRQEMSATAILQATAERFSEINGRLNAFVHMDWEIARAQASRVDAAVARGQDPGPLAGVPFGVKDLQHCAGMPTRYGSLLHAGDGPVHHDSPSVAALRAAGAVPIGKTATAEYGLASETATRAHGPTRNPWNLALTPGGSSGGSAAAVAGHLVPFATGTDVGGSIRTPAAWCGLIGLKPSHGRVPRDDGGDDMNTHGVLTRTVADSARILDVLNRPDPRDKMSMLLTRDVRFETACAELDIGGLRAVWSDDLGYAAVEAEVSSIAGAAAQRLIRAAALTQPDIPAPALADPGEAFVPVIAARFLRQLTADGHWPDSAGRLSEAARGFATYGAGVDAGQLARAERSRAELERQVAGLFEATDVIITPAAACAPYRAEGPPPPTIAGRPASLIGAEPFAAIANLTWLPAISIPAGLDRGGLPVGLHIIARWGREDVLLRLARIWEGASG